MQAEGRRFDPDQLHQGCRGGASGGGTSTVVVREVRQADEGAVVLSYFLRAARLAGRVFFNKLEEVVQCMKMHCTGCVIASVVLSVSATVSPHKRVRL